VSRRFLPDALGHDVLRARCECTGSAGTLCRERRRRGGCLPIGSRL